MKALAQPRDDVEHCKPWPAFRDSSPSSAHVAEAQECIRCMIAPEKVSSDCAKGVGHRATQALESAPASHCGEMDCRRQVSSRASCLLDQQRPYALAKVGVRATLHRDTNSIRKTAARLRVRALRAAPRSTRHSSADPLARAIRRALSH